MRDGADLQEEEEVDPVAVAALAVLSSEAAGQ